MRASPGGPLDGWMKARGLAERCHYRIDTGQGMLAGVCHGLGVAVLPCYLADREPCLVRISDPIEELATDVWLLTHPDLRKAARIRALMDFLARAVRREADRLQGTAAATRPM